MAGNILIALKRRDRIEDLTPYIKEMPKPGTRVVFLVPYPVNGFAELLHDGFVTTESPGQVAHEARKFEAKYSWEGQRRSAEKKIAPASKALREAGVEAAVEVYSGSLREAVEAYAPEGNAQLIMIQKKTGFRIRSFFQKRPFSSLQLLLLPIRGAQARS